MLRTKDDMPLHPAPPTRRPQGEAEGPRQHQDRTNRKEETPLLDHVSPLLIAQDPAAEDPRQHQGRTDRTEEPPLLDYVSPLLIAQDPAASSRSQASLERDGNDETAAVTRQRRRQESPPRLEYATPPMIDQYPATAERSQPRRKPDSTAQPAGDVTQHRQDRQRKQPQEALPRPDCVSPPTIDRPSAASSAQSHPFQKPDDSTAPSGWSETTASNEQGGAPSPLANRPSINGAPSQSKIDAECEKKANHQQKKQPDITVWKERDLRRERSAVLSAYADFFEHISLRRGWKTVPFTMESVRTLLDEAALIVVRIRRGLDETDPGFKLRQLDGSAREYMWTVTEDPGVCPRRGRQFVREVVHATFRDKEGYVEGLTAERVERGIDRFLDLP